MRYAINVPNFGAIGDARTLADCAREAETAGWDGFFLWDHIGASWPMPVADPWVVLPAMAMVTQRIKIGTLVTPLPRRRPWKLAREAVSLDRLSEGRLILGVGTGSDSGREYSAFGEATDDKRHGAMLDEALDVLLGLWSGETFSYTGEHYTVRAARFLPTPVQQPRIPIWVSGVWPHKRPFRRAARWDGVVPLRSDGQAVTPDDVRAMLAYIREHRTSTDTATSATDAFDVTVYGATTDVDAAAATALLDQYGAAGVTWWQEGFMPDDSLDRVRQRIRRGPPGR